MAGKREKSAKKASKMVIEPTLTIIFEFETLQGLLQIVRNEDTRQYWWRLMGRNYKILCGTEPIKRKTEVLQNLKAVEEFFRVAKWEFPGADFIAEEMGLKI